MFFNLPTLLTWARIVAIPLVVGVYYTTLPAETQNLVGTALFILFALTDWADGYLARRLNMTSSFGAFLDPVADKFLVCASLLVLVHLQRADVFVALIIIGREIAISALREWMAQIGARSKVKVAFLGKLKTLAQMVALVVLLVQHDTESLASYNIGEALLVLAGILTIWSGVDYLRAAWPSLRGDSDDVKKSEKKSVQSG